MNTYLLLAIVKLDRVGLLGFSVVNLGVSYFILEGMIIF